MHQSYKLSCSENLSDVKVLNFPNADVAKLVDAVDSKSSSSNRVPVRVRPSAYPGHFPKKEVSFIILIDYRSNFLSLSSKF